MGVDAVMVVQHDNVLDSTQVAALSGQMAAMFGTDYFWIVKPDLLAGKMGHHALSVVEEDHYRLEDLPAAPQSLEVNWMMRYYGPGYERGNWPVIRGVGEFLETALPGSRVYYGGDSSDLTDLFDADRRQALNDHFLASGHEPYRGYSLREAKTPKCDFCGGKPFHNVGGGGGSTFWSCDGCDTRMVEDSAGKFTIKKKDEKWW